MGSAFEEIFWTKTTGSRRDGKGSWTWLLEDPRLFCSRSVGFEAAIQSRGYKNDPKLPLKHVHLGDSIALKVLGHHKLQNPLHLAVQVQVRRSRFHRSHN
jgi:hypothetical protein